MTRAIQFLQIQFLSILDKYFKSYSNINAIWPLFGMGSYQIWPCHVTQAKNLSFLCLKSYCPLNFRKVTRFRGSAESLTEVIKKTIWRRAESAPTPHLCGTGLNIHKVLLTGPLSVIASLILSLLPLWVISLVPRTVKPLRCKDLRFFSLSISRSTRPILSLYDVLDSAMSRPINYGSFWICFSYFTNSSEISFSPCDYLWPFWNYPLSLEFLKTNLIFFNNRHKCVLP